MVEDRSIGHTVFVYINYSFLAVLAVVCLAPMIHELAISLSASGPAGANEVKFWPIDFTLSSYEKLMDNKLFLNSLWVSVKRTALGTVISMLLTVLMAYALSKETINFKGRSVYLWMSVFTMMFSGGIIPTFMVVNKMGLMDTIWALVLPGAVSIWNTILMLNFFRSLPKELEEAAFVDGAGHWKTLFMIFIPLSLPAIATLSLFAMVGHWNAWFDGLIYMSSRENYPLQTYLQTTIIQDMNLKNVNSSMVQNFSNKTVNAAQIFLGMLPILLVYPFLQRFFVTGIVLGSVKE